MALSGHVPTTPALERLLADFGARRPAALARAVSIVEDQRPGADQLLSALHRRLGAGRRIGITGPPGAGKSTLCTRLASHYRSLGLTVGVIAVDPTSPFTGGALLGDRIRMEAIALDPGIFIRSMATRGSLGGLATATRDVVDVLDAFGFDRILVETVGVGQSELDIARTADTSVVALVPESGDAIQTLKAGLMEIADVFVINKADRPGADRLRHEVEVMLGLRVGQAFRNVPAHHGLDLRRIRNPASLAREAAGGSAIVAEVAGNRTAQRTVESGWTPPVLGTTATTGAGVPELATAVERHFDYLEQTGELHTRRRQRLRERVMDAAARLISQRFWADAGVAAWLDEQLPAMERGALTPLAAAEALLRRGANLLTRAEP